MRTRLGRLSLLAVFALSACGQPSATKSESSAEPNAEVSQSTKPVEATTSIVDEICRLPNRFDYQKLDAMLKLSHYSDIKAGLADSAKVNCWHKLVRALPWTRNSASIDYLVSFLESGYAGDISKELAVANSISWTLPALGMAVCLSSDPTDYADAFGLLRSGVDPKFWLTYQTAWHAPTEHRHHNDLANRALVGLSYTCKAETVSTLEAIENEPALLAFYSKPILDGYVKNAKEIEAKGLLGAWAQE